MSSNLGLFPLWLDAGMPYTQCVCPSDATWSGLRPVGPIVGYINLDPMVSPKFLFSIAAVFLLKLASL